MEKIDKSKVPFYEERKNDCHFLINEKHPLLKKLCVGKFRIACNDLPLMF